ncbi:MAG TPA: MBOAT family O-acyltransferase [Bryobacteraceae bacterium]|nr:MBOAT family O-acyltransferase [Bryobacteraceae bacterium]
MILSSPGYLTFLVLVYLVFWLLRKNRLAALGVILLANYFFYAKWSLIYLALIPIASTIDYLVALALERVKGAVSRRALVSVSVLMNVALIASARYAPLLLGLTGHAASGWTLPLSLSFYGFQAMTYTIDVYRRDAKAAKSLLAYLTTVSFFPTTLAGPITRPAALLPQWEKNQTLSAEDGGRALFLIAIGLTKKFLIADYLAENLINRVFDLPKLYSGTEVLVGVYAYAFQLYYDFSGYTDMALGSALLLGMRLPTNFNQPYLAENIADFWRRWHISLSNWLRDYLYFSLPGKRTRVMPYVNLIVTFAIGGLWHGANWNFGIWGLIHGVGLAVTRGWQRFRGKKKPSANPVFHALRVLAAFHFVVFAWIFFRAANLAVARDILSQIFSGTAAWANITPGFWAVLAVAVAGHYLPKNWYERCQRLYIAAPFYAQAAALAGLALAIQYVAATGAAPFIYSKF